MLLFSSLAAFAAGATAPLPEVARPAGSTAAQAIGTLHTLRNIPEACVRLEGLFTGDATEPYRLEVLPGNRCVQRATWVDAVHLKQPPSTASHWILNDRITVPRADAAACVATVNIWREPGTAAPPALDAQGRARLYLDKPQTAAGLQKFTAVLAVTKACKVPVAAD